MSGAEIIALAFAVAFVAAAVVTVLSLVRADGFGRRPAPMSHRPWSAGDLPSRPFRLS